MYVRLESERHATALEVIAAFYNVIDFEPVTPVDDYGDEIEPGIPVYWEMTMLSISYPPTMRVKFMISS